MEKRFFNGKKERADILFNAKWQCIYCGDPLPKNWHADHKTPFVLGGKTIIENASASCPRCNLRKGKKIMKQFSPRKWQVGATRDFFDYIKTKNNFLAGVWPGGGKTKWALSVAKELLERDEIQQILIISHSINIKEKWSQDAEQFFNIKIDSSFNSILTSEFQGASVTYQQLFLTPSVFRQFRKLLVIFDEIHHIGEQAEWGKIVQTALPAPKYILGLSGTPFRSDDQKIPFFTDHYQEISREGKILFELIPNYVYPYSRAIEENVCVNTHFHPWDTKGETKITWESFRNGEFVTLAHSFADDVDEPTASARLRNALNAEGEKGFLESMIRDADERLSSMRKSFPRAGGLIICRSGWNGEEIEDDNRHLRQVAKLVEKISGEPPIIVSSQEELSNIKIEKFKHSDAKWLVSIKMVSEGVDIPRLRTLVYATTVTSRLFFIQALGRIIRNDDFYSDFSQQEAHFYFPADPLLHEFSYQIMEKNNHVVSSQKKDALLPTKDLGDGTEIISRPGDVLLESPEGVGGWTYTGVVLNEEMKKLLENGRRAGIPDESLAKWALLNMKDKETSAEPVQEEFKTTTERKKRYRSLISDLTNRIASQRLRANGVSDERFKLLLGQEIRRTHQRYNKIQGVRDIDECTENQLKTRYEALKGGVKNGR